MSPRLAALLVPILLAAAPRQPYDADQMKKLRAAADVPRRVTELGKAGKHAEAAALWEKRVALERELLGDHPVLIRSLEGLVMLRRKAGLWDAAAAACREHVAITARLHGGSSWRAARSRIEAGRAALLARLDDARRTRLLEASRLNGQVVRLWEGGKSEEALPLARRAAAIFREVAGADRPEYGLALFNVGCQHMALKQPEEALRLFRQAEPILRGPMGPEEPDLALIHFNIGKQLAALKRDAEAADAYGRAAAIYRVGLGARHYKTLEALFEQGSSLYTAGRHARAAALLAGVKRRADEEFGADNSLSTLCMVPLGIARHRLGRHAEARDTLAEARRRIKAAGQERSSGYWNVLDILSESHGALGEIRAQREALEELWRLARAREGERSRSYRNVTFNLALSCQQGDDHAAARALLRGLTEANRRDGVRENQAESLAALAQSEAAMGGIAAARKAMEEAREVSAKVNGRKSPAHATILNNFGDLLGTQSDFRAAIAMYEEALSVQRAAKGERDAGTVTYRANLAMCRLDMGDYAGARGEMKQVLSAAAAALGEAHPVYATFLTNHGVMLAGAGDYDGAEAAFARALTLHERHGRVPSIAAAHAIVSTAKMLRERGEAGRALEAARRAGAMARAAAGARNRIAMEALNQEASSLQDLGDARAAVGVFEKALAQAREVYGPRGRRVGDIMNNLALAYEESGDEARGKRMAEESCELTVATLGRGHAAYGTALHNRGALLHRIGDNSDALVLLHESLAVQKRTRGERTVGAAKALMHLGAVYQALGDGHRALTLYGRALALNEALLGADNIQCAYILRPLAESLRRAGDHRAALASFRRALAIHLKTQGPRHRSTFGAMGDLAAGLHWAGDHAGAARMLEDARRGLRELGGGPEMGTCLINLGLAYRAMDRLDEAEAVSRQGMRLVAGEAGRMLGALSARQRLLYVTRYRSGLGQYLSAALAAGVPAARMYELALPGKGLALPLSDERLAGPGQAAAAARLREARAGLARLAAAPPTRAEMREAWARQLAGLEGEKERLEAELSRDSEAFRRHREARLATPEDVAAALPRGAALVDYLAYSHVEGGDGRRRAEGRLLAFVLAPGRETVCVPLGPLPPIGEAVAGWRRAVLRGEDARRAAEKVAALVWDPLRKHLTGCGSVIVSPDGALWGLSFAALPGRRPGSYLVEDVAVGLVTSGLHPLENKALPAARADGLLVVAGLDYGEGAGLWARLPGAGREGEVTAALYRGAFRGSIPETLGGADADGVRLKRSLSGGRHRYLHLATHGYFEPRGASERSPLLASGLVLSGANAKPAEGTLTAEEVAGLDLRGCELAALSACETGRGIVADGEGVLGLQRAFQMAGARATLTSLWSVSDPATSVLMERFYEGLWGKERLTKLEALRQAQLFVLNNPAAVSKRAGELRAGALKRGVSEAELAARGAGKEAVALPGGKARSHPSWWAAFVLCGEG